METSSRLYHESFARDDRLLHMQSEALEKERDQLALEAARVLPQSRRLLETRRSLSPHGAIDRLSTPKTYPAQSMSPGKRKGDHASVSPPSSSPNKYGGGAPEAAADGAGAGGVMSERLDQLSQPRSREVGKAVDLSVQVSQIPTIARAQATLDHVGQWPYGIPDRPCDGPMWAPPASPHAAPGSTAGDESGARQGQASRRAATGGIGIQLTQKKNDTFVIDAVPAGGPAADSGRIEVGDELLAVDGVKIGGRDMAFAASRITGAPGTSVKLSLLRRSFTRGSNAERRRQFVVSVTRKAPPSPLKDAQRQAPLKDVKSPVPVLELGQQGDSTSPEVVRHFKSPRNRSDAASDGAEPPPQPEPRFKSPRNHEPLASMEAPPNRGAGRAGRLGEDQDTSAPLRLSFVDTERGAPEEWYAKPGAAGDVALSSKPPRPVGRKVCWSCESAGLLCVERWRGRQGCAVLGVGCGVWGVRRAAFGVP